MSARSAPRGAGRQPARAPVEQRARGLAARATTSRRTLALIAAAPAAAAYVYLLRCRDGALYCGWTDDLAARLATHRRGRGSAFVRSRLPVELVYVEPCADRSSALRRELAIKRLTRAEKLALVARR